MGGGPWSRVMVPLSLSFPLQLLVSCPSPPGTRPWARRDNFEVGSKRSRVDYRIWAHVKIPPLKQRSGLMEQEEGEKKTKQKVAYLILHWSRCCQKNPILQTGRKLRTLVQMTEEQKYSNPQTVPRLNKPLHNNRPYWSLQTVISLFILWLQVKFLPLLIR